jgi:hypothetical protein
MNTCVETVPSQLRIDLAAHQPATQEPVAPKIVAQGEPAPARPVSTKQSWFSVLWRSARKSQYNKQTSLATLPVASLPGVGQTHAKALVERGVTTAGQLRRIPKPVLVAAFGQAIGRHIWECARS